MMFLHNTLIHDAVWIVGPRPRQLEMLLYILRKHIVHREMLSIERPRTMADRNPIEHLFDRAANCIGSVIPRLACQRKGAAHSSCIHRQHDIEDNVLAR